MVANYLSESVPECIREEVALKVQASLNDGHLVRYVLDPEKYPIKSKIAILTTPKPTNLQKVESEEESYLRKLRKRFSSIKLKNVGSLREKAIIYGFDYHGMYLVESYLQLIKDLGFQEDGSGGVSIYLNYRVAFDKMNELEGVAAKLKVRLARHAYYSTRYVGQRFLVT